MSQTKQFGPGEIRLLWLCGYYDGMLSGVGLVEDQPVWLQVKEEGGWVWNPEWKAFLDLMYKLLPKEDADPWHNKLEEEYEMFEERVRTYHVYPLSSEEWGALRKRHYLFQVHVGRHTTYFYKDGVPYRPYFGGSKFLQAYNDALPKEDMPRPWLEREPLGEVSYTTLYEKTSFEDSEPQEIRSPELIKYQDNWKPGDPFIMDWSEND